MCLVRNFLEHVVVWFSQSLLGVIVHDPHFLPFSPLISGEAPIVKATDDSIRVLPLTVLDSRCSGYIAGRREGGREDRGNGGREEGGREGGWEGGRVMSE